MRTLYLVSMFLSWLQLALVNGLNLRTIINRDYGCNDPRITNKMECKMIMNQPYLIKSYRGLQIMSEEELRAAREAHFRVLGEETVQPPCNIHMSNEYIQNHSSQPGAYSLSPYDSKQDFDDSRIPSVIQQEKCLCESCINPQTRREDRTNAFHSAPFQVSVKVLKSIGGRTPLVVVKETMTIGCTCVFKKTVSL